jgi:hypothetical protein
MRVPATAVATLIAVAMEGKLSTLSFAFLGKSFRLWPQPVEPLLGIAGCVAYQQSAYYAPAPAYYAPAPAYYGPALGPSVSFEFRGGDRDGITITSIGAEQDDRRYSALTRT